MTRTYPAPDMSSSNNTIQIPALIQSYIYKESKGVKAGITLKNDNMGRVVVKKKSALFLSSEIQVGDEIIAVNGYPISSTKEAITFLRDAEGKVDITAVAGENHSTTTTTEASSNKDNSMEPYGQFTFGRKFDSENSFGIWFDTTRDVLVRVARISPTSPFATSMLRQGDIILSVNGHVVTQAQHADQIVARAVSDGAPLALFSFSVERYCESLLSTCIIEPESSSSTSRFDKYTIEKIDQFNTKLIRKDRKFHATLHLKHNYESFEIIHQGSAKGSSLEQGRAHLSRLSKKVAKMNGMLRLKIAVIENTVMSMYKPLDTGAKFVSNLIQLGDMRKEGLLSEVEFEAAKSKLLDLQPTHELPVVQAIAAAY
mmetsp:Transcript_22841/g.35239  ORF Transcript_22841/g.35239 Transcript_22841/m.35239 type:complete len:371 (+) Transcript_22841:186-1298(+)